MNKIGCVGQAAEWNPEMSRQYPVYQAYQNEKEHSVNKASYCNINLGNIIIQCETTA